jgi:hypothetical protein
MVVEDAIWAFLRIGSPPVTGIFMNDVLNLIIVPSIVFIVMLETISGKFLGNDHKNWTHLLSIAFYMLIITQGIYGPLASFISTYMLAFLVLAGIVFLGGKMITLPGAVSTVGGAKIITEALTEKARLRKELQRKIAYTDNKIRELQNRINHLNGMYPPGAPRPGNIDNEIYQLQSQVHLLNQQKVELEYNLVKLNS